MALIDEARLIEVLLPVVERVAALQLRYRSTGIAVTAKADQSPVTVADQESEAEITAALALAMPGVPIIAEEAVSAGTMPDTGELFFLVDPLDGTREFVAGSDEFTINIALIENGRPRFGLVAAAALGEVFVTTAKTSVVKGRLGADPAAVGLARIAPYPVRTRPPDLDHLCVIASRSHASPELERHLAHMKVGERMSVGSSLKFCRIAEGRADVYPRLGEICEWDTAAGHAVLLAAGGAVTTVDGGALQYGKKQLHFRQPWFVAWGRAELATKMSFA